MFLYVGFVKTIKSLYNAYRGNKCMRKKRRLGLATNIGNTVHAAGEKAQYDQKAKQILRDKNILAHILVKSIDDFRGMNPKDVIPFIEGDPYVSVVPVDESLTNTEVGTTEDGDRIIGMNTEDSAILEGLIRFDVVFYLRLKDGISQVIVNVEAQKDEPSEYDIINRAVFYTSRMISSQKERDFTNSNYNDIRRVYSIWVCMNQIGCSLNYIHLTNDTILGNKNWKGDMELVNIVLLGIPDELPEHTEEYELHRLLSAVFSGEVPEERKLQIMNEEYDIEITRELREEMNIMCNLSKGIEEKAEAKAIKAKNIRIVLSMNGKGFPISDIAEIAEISEEEVKEIIDQNKGVVLV